MNRLAQLVLLLHLPFCAYGMDLSPAASTSSSSRSSSDLSHANLDDIIGMDGGSASSAATGDGLNSGGSIADALGISQPASERSVLAGAMRYVAKFTGFLDISGASSDATERGRTARIVAQHTEMLSSDQEVDLSQLKQFLARQSAAEYTAIMLLKKLQAFNQDQDALPDVVRKIEHAQQLLTLHEGSTLCPQTAVALKATLEISRRFARDKLDQSDINSSDS